MHGHHEDPTIIQRGQSQQQHAVDTSLSKKRKMALVFSAELAQSLVLTDRLPPTYIGVRKIRASTRDVQKQAFSSSSTLVEQHGPVVFKVTDPHTGEERRMTSKEKREQKWKMKQQLKTAKQQSTDKKQGLNTAGTNSSSNTADLDVIDPQPSLNGMTDTCDVDANIELQLTKPFDDNYFAIQPSKSCLDQEIADLRGERVGVPPVALSFSAARQLPLCNPPLHDDEVTTLTSICKTELSDEYSEKWAAAVEQSFEAALEVRAKEDMREMPYDLIPQKWTRMRPRISSQASPVEPTDQGLSGVVSGDVIWVDSRLASIAFDKAIDAVVHLLHQQMPTIHVSCGAKFGCDLLLYDGPRTERHAFAGLRVFSSHVDDNDNVVWPLPTAYCLSGYVRCLNTAGKLALIATKVTNTNGISCIAIVDLALERRASVRLKRVRRRWEDRAVTLSKK
jgi:hypothetical protein